MRFVLSAARDLHDSGIMLGKLPRSQRRAALFDLAVHILTSCLQKSSMSLPVLYPIQQTFARGRWACLSKAYAVSRAAFLFCTICSAMIPATITRPIRSETVPGISSVSPPITASTRSGQCIVRRI